MSNPSWSWAERNTEQDNYVNEEEEDYNYNDSYDPSVKRFKKPSIVGGAAIVGTATGLIVAGPLIGIVGGVAAAIVATQDSRAGKVARSTGESVLIAGETVQDFSQKNQIVEKTKWGFRKVSEKAGEIDERHQVVAKGKRGVDNALKRAQEVDKNHDIRGSINDRWQEHFDKLASKFRGEKNSHYSDWEHNHKKRQELEEGTNDLMSNEMSVTYANNQNSKNFSPW